MTIKLGLAPAIALQKRISQAAIFTGSMIYLEGVAALALLTEQVLSVAALIPIVLVMGAQFRVVRRPVRLLVRDRLVASYRLFFSSPSCSSRSLGSEAARATSG